MSPHTTRNPTIPTAAQIRMFVIAHLVSVSSFGTPWRPSHTAESAFPPDGAHYALIRFPCLLGKQPNQNAYFSQPLPDKWETELVRIVDAFSHPNRLAMLIRLAQGPATIHELFEAAGVVVKSIYHHL